MKDRAAYYDSMSMTIPGPCYDKIGTNPSPSFEAPFIKWLIKLDEIKRDIVKKDEELKNLKSEALLKIEALDNEDYKTILIERYFNGMTWDEIAKKVYASKATVKRWHEESLLLMKIG